MKYTEEKNRTKTFKTFADVCYDEQTNVQVDWWIADFKYRLTIFFNKYQTKKVTLSEMNEHFYSINHIFTKTF